METGLFADVIDQDGALIPAPVFEGLGARPVPHVLWRSDPVGWADRYLGIPRYTLEWSVDRAYRKHKWDGTKDPIAEMLRALARGEDTGVESATGTGKSFGAGVAVLWFLGCWENSRVFSYAPKEDQLRLYMWAEIAELWPRFHAHFPTADLSDLRIRMYGTDKWSAHGVATQVKQGEESATRAQGAHAPHMLHITEETPGIPTPVMTAIRNTRGGSHNLHLALGNPDNIQDPLHNFCEQPTTTAIRVSAQDHPNVVTGRDVIPGAVTRRGIALIAQEDAPGTPMYESRVRGISPAESVYALIQTKWLEAAAAKYEARLKLALARREPRALGVDVANSEDGDKAAKAYMRGPVLTRVIAFQCPDSNALGREVAVEITNDLDPIDPQAVGVDPVGVGAGTVNELEGRKVGGEPAPLMIRRLFGSASPVQQAARGDDGAAFSWVPDANRFLNLRSQMAWQLREDIRMGRWFGAKDKKLWRQLTAWQFKVEGGKVIVESKKDMMKRTGSDSPNDFDAVMYANWVRPRAEAGDPPTADTPEDQSPGFDYKNRRKKERHRPVADPEAGDEFTSIADDDLRPNRYHVPLAGFKTPRYVGEQDFTEEE